MEALHTLVWPLLLALPRVVTALTVGPLFPAALFPRLLRSTVAVSLSLAVYPHIAAHLPATALTASEWMTLVAKEMFIGMLIGVSMGALTWAFESAGSLIDLQVGTSNAQFFDPFGGHQAGPFTTLMGRLAIALFIAGGGLFVFVTLLFESFRLWPVGALRPELGPQLMDFASTSVQSLAELAARVAAPVIFLLALVDLGFGLVNRVAPQLNVFFFTMPIKGALAALMIGLYVSYLMDLAAGHVGELGTLLERLRLLFAGN